MVNSVSNNITATLHARYYNYVFAANLVVGVTEWGAKGDWTFMGVYGGLFAVDSFFLLGSVL